MTRVLLIGLHGQVGRTLLPLLATKFEVQATQRPQDLDQGPLPAGISITELDLCDTGQIQGLIRKVKPDVIINCAAYNAVDKAETDSETAHQINSLAPGMMAKTAAEIGAGIVHFSSDYVYAGTGTAPFCESSPTAPQSAYGRSKLGGDQAILAADIPHIIFRTSWVVSPFGHNFVKTMLRLGNDKKELRVVSDQIGAPTSARMLADATVRCLTSAPANGQHSLRKNLQKLAGIYHVACRGEVSWHSLAEEIFRIARGFGQPLAVERVLPISSEEFGAPAKRPKNSRLRLDKIEKTLGFQLPWWQTEIRDIVAELLRI